MSRDDQKVGQSHAFGFPSSNTGKFHVGCMRSSIRAWSILQHHLMQALLSPCDCHPVCASGLFCLYDMSLSNRKLILIKTYFCGSNFTLFFFNCKEHHSGVYG